MEAIEKCFSQSDDDKDNSVRFVAYHILRVSRESSKRPPQEQLRLLHFINFTYLDYKAEILNLPAY